MIQAAQQIHQRAFAGATCPHQCNEFATGDVQRYSPENWNRNLAKMVGPANVFQFNQFHAPFNSPLTFAFCAGAIWVCLPLALSTTHWLGHKRTAFCSWTCSSFPG